jgi:hypothetical protein
MQWEGEKVDELNVWVIDDDDDMVAVMMMMMMMMIVVLLLYFKLCFTCYSYHQQFYSFLHYI